MPRRARIVRVSPAAHSAMAVRGSTSRLSSINSITGNSRAPSCPCRLSLRYPPSKRMLSLPHCRLTIRLPVLSGSPLPLVCGPHFNRLDHRIERLGRIPLGHETLLSSAMIKKKMSWHCSNMKQKHHRTGLHPLHG